jgi:hypothetical protein
MSDFRVNEYSTFEARDVLQVEYMRLNEWLKLVPPTRKAEGRGTRSVLSRTDLYRLKLFSLLLQYGVKRERAAAIVVSTNKLKPEEFDTRYVNVVLTSSGLPLVAGIDTRPYTGEEQNPVAKSAEVDIKKMAAQAKEIGDKLKARFGEIVISKEQLQKEISDHITTSPAHAPETTTLGWIVIKLSAVKRMVDTELGIKQMADRTR